MNRPEGLQVEVLGDEVVEVKISAARDVLTTTYIETEDGRCFIREQLRDEPTVLPLEPNGWGGAGYSGDLAALKRSQESPVAAREYMLNQGENARDFGAYTSRKGEASAKQAARVSRVEQMRQAAAAR